MLEVRFWGQVNLCDPNRDSMRSMARPIAEGDMFCPLIPISSQECLLRQLGGGPRYFDLTSQVREPRGMNKELRATLHSMHRTSVNQFDMDLAARRIMENECAFDALLAGPRYPWTELSSDESQFSFDLIQGVRSLPCLGLNREI